MFQFLLGTLKTFFVCGNIPSMIPVSIPFRYAENLDCLMLRLRIILFQFLLGTLKTPFALLN